MTNIGYHTKAMLSVKQCSMHLYSLRLSYWLLHDVQTLPKLGGLNMSCSKDKVIERLNVIGL